VITYQFTTVYINIHLLERLPYSVRVLLESAVRNCDEFNVK